MKFVQAAVKARKVNLLALDRASTVSDDLFFYELPVDSKLKEFTVSVSGDKPQIIITDPRGTCLYYQHFYTLSTCVGLCHNLIIVK